MNFWEPPQKYQPPPEPPPILLPPHQQETFMSAVIIPGVQTLISGFLSGLTFGVIWWALTLPQPWKAGWIFGLLISVTFWAINLRAWTMRLEKLLNVDLNFDGYKGPPPPPAPIPRVKIELGQIHEGSRQLDIIDLPATPDQLRTLAQGVLAGRTFAEDVWAPGLFSKPAFSKLRDEMVSRGLARWKNPNAHAQGVEPTAAGKAILRKLAEIPPTLPDS